MKTQPIDIMLANQMRDNTARTTMQLVNMPTSISTSEDGRAPTAGKTSKYWYQLFQGFFFIIVAFQQVDTLMIHHP